MNINWTGVVLMSILLLGMYLVGGTVALGFGLILWGLLSIAAQVIK